jgi:hypothetical protein
MEAPVLPVAEAVDGKQGKRKMRKKDPNYALKTV